VTIPHPKFESRDMQWIDVMSDFAIIDGNENHCALRGSPNEIPVRHQKLSPVACHDAKRMERISVP
jgi:hypothetical protein